MLPPDILDYVGHFCDIDSRRALGLHPRPQSRAILPRTPLPVTVHVHGYSFVELRLPHYDHNLGTPGSGSGGWNVTCIILLYDHWRNKRMVRIPTFDAKRDFWYFDGTFSW